MVTIFIISFIVLCFSLMIVMYYIGIEVTNSWHMITWRLLLVLSVIGSVILTIQFSGAEYGFTFLHYLISIFILAICSFLGATLLWTIFCLIAWIFGTKTYVLIDFLAGQ